MQYARVVKVDSNCLPLSCNSLEMNGRKVHMIFWGSRLPKEADLLETIGNSASSVNTALDPRARASLRSSRIFNPAMFTIDLACSVFSGTKAQLARRNAQISQ